MSCINNVLLHFYTQSTNLLLLTGASGVFTLNLISNTFSIKSTHLSCAFDLFHICSPHPCLLPSFRFFLTLIFQNVSRIQPLLPTPTTAFLARTFSLFLRLRRWPPDSSPCFSPPSHFPPSPGHLLSKRSQNEPLSI